MLSMPMLHAALPHWVVWNTVLITRNNSIDLNQTWAEQSRGSNLVGAGEGTGRVGDNGKGKAVHDELVEGEERLECDVITLDFDVLWLLNDWQVLLVGVDEADLVHICAVVLEGELQVLALWLDVLGVDCQRAEDWQVDDVLVRAGAWNNDHLVEDRECPWAGGAGQEWKLRRDEVKQRAVIPILYDALLVTGKGQKFRRVLPVHLPDQ